MCVCVNTDVYLGDKFGHHTKSWMNLYESQQYFVGIVITPTSKRRDSIVKTMDRDRRIDTTDFMDDNNDRLVKNLY